jgi:hypothetical protein
MEARLIRTALVVAALLSLGAGYRTENFIVDAPTPELAKEIGDLAETFRHDLAIEWLGRELPPWIDKCPIRAQVSPRLGAGGATSFVFRGGEPREWTMSIQGSRERILDSVLPHEVTHTIFATHFRRPLPRWADEGACTTVEHSSERGKQERMLIEFLTTNRGIAFNSMFAMTEYPSDVLPLYSQGYALAQFLIHQGGKHKFMEYVGDGMKMRNWNAATRKHYGYHDLSELQVSWLEWVRRRRPDSIPGDLVAKNRQQSPAGANTLALASAPGEAAAATNNAGLVAVAPPSSGKPPPTAEPTAQVASRGESSIGGWYAKQRDEAKGLAPRTPATFAASSAENRLSSVPPQSPQVAAAPQSVTRPQPPEQAKQVILQWNSQPRYQPGSTYGAELYGREGDTKWR